jgi:hypothetical protein
LNAQTDQGEVPVSDTLVPLNAIRHRDLRFLPNQPFHFARGMMLCPLVSGELRQIARDYVIVFPMEGGLPQALLGTEEGNNAYVADSGHWLCRYVPAHLRRHPFFALREPSGNGIGGEGSFVIGLDEDAPHLSRSDGAPLFDAQGKPTPVLEKIKTVLASLEQDSAATARMVAQLEEHGLLISRHIRIKPKAGSERAMTGFRVIDTDGLMKLAPDALSAMQKSGALLVAYAHVISLANLVDGSLLSAPAQKASDAFDLSESVVFDFERFN